MFRDTQEELDRLERQLLEEDDWPETEKEEDYSEFLQSDGEQPQEPLVYRNFSNDYGKDLRNYATGYKAYNSDHVDEELDSFSQAVQEEKERGPIWLLAVVLALMAAVVAAIVWVYVDMGGPL